MDPDQEALARKGSHAPARSTEQTRLERTPLRASDEEPTAVLPGGGALAPGLMGAPAREEPRED
ncbi:hypothetical protein ACN28I_38445 [Archangium gephyra]|uniref:hypothetical protein n=1 Tax=Archangium gephyra TaxID=48 RepID=UPI003B800048